MISSPLRFQLGMAAVAVSGALAVTAAQGPRPDPEPVLTLQDPAIDESSGLVDLGDRVLTVNDSGDGPVIYVVDRSTGATVGRTSYTFDEVVDVEAMAPGLHGTVWVGDIGDNGGARTSVAVYAVPAVQDGDRSVESRRFDLMFEDGPRDAETLLVHPTTGRLYVVSKGLFGGKVYAAPKTLDAGAPNVLRPVGEAQGMITDGAFFPDGRHIAIRSYTTLRVLETRRWETVESMGLPDQNQGEGLAMMPSGEEVLVSTEGAQSDVLRVPLTRGILDQVTPLEVPSTAPSEAPPLPAPPEAAAPDDATWQQVVGVGLVALALVGTAAWWLRRRDL